MKHPGDAAADYLSENVMVAVSKAMTATLTSRPNPPVQSFANLLKRNNNMRPVMQVEANLGSGSIPVTFVSRPSLLEPDSKAQARGFALPTSFFKCGEYPVYSCDVPSMDVLSNVAKYLVQTEKVSEICWVLASTSSTLLAYIRGDAFRGKCDLRQWEKERRDLKGPADDEDIELSMLSKAASALGRKAKLLPFPDAIFGLEPGVPMSTVREFHPADVPVDPRVLDRLSQALAMHCSSESSVCVLLTCDEPTLNEHLRTSLTIYFRELRTVQHIRRTLHIVESQEDLEFVRDFDKHEKQLKAARAQRDKTRDMLFRAHIANLVDEGQLNFDKEYEANEVRRVMRQQRREDNDRRLRELVETQNGLAATKVQKIVRGLLTRRKSEAVVRKDLSECLHLYEHGRFPLVEATLNYLQVTYGATLVSSDVPKRGTTHESKLWKYRRSRVAPVDEVDISSEDEDWEEVVVNRMSTDVSRAINPHFDVDCCLKIARNSDKAFLFECFVDYLDQPAMQARSVRTLERLVHYLLYAVYVFVRLRIVEAASADVSPFASKSLLDLPHRLEGIESYEAFLFLNRRPLDWLSQPQFVLQSIANQPTSIWAMRRLCAGVGNPPLASMTTATAVSNSTNQQEQQQQPLAGQNGQLYEGNSNAELFLPGSPIYIVPDGLTADQWTETAVAVLRSHPRGKKVLWVTTNPELCVYANGTPFFLIHRLSSDTGGESVSGSGAGGGGGVLQSSNSSSYILKDLSLGGGGAGLLDQSTLRNRSSSFSVSVNQQQQQQQHDDADEKQQQHAPLIKVTRSTSVLGESMSVTPGQVGAGGRRSEGTWFTISWDNVETSIIQDLIPIIDSTSGVAEGRLPYFHPSWMRTRPPLTTAADEPAAAGMSVLTVAISPTQNYFFPSKPATFLEYAAKVTMTRDARSASRSRRLSTVPSTSSTPRQSVAPVTQTLSSLFKPTIRAPRVPRKGSTASVTTTSENEAESDHNDVIAFPAKAEDALRTPQQIADEVKQRLRANGYESGMLYRRLPMFPHMCDELLRALDHMLQNLRENLMDPAVMLVFTIAGADSVFHCMLGTILWLTDYKKHWTSSSSLAPGSSFCSRPNQIDQSFSTDSSPPADDCDSSTHHLPPPNMLADFPVLRQIDDEHPHLQLADVVAPFVAKVLQDGRARDVLYDPVITAMTAAQNASTAAMSKQHCVEASCGFEKLLLLLFFKAFCDTVQDKRLGGKWSFREYMLNNPSLLQLVLTCSPWDKQPAHRRCPVDSSDVVLSADHRWRRSLVMPNNS